MKGVVPEASVGNTGAATEAAPETVVAVAPPRFVKPITKTVPLQYPVEWNGKIYDSVSLHRVTAKEVTDFVAAMATAKGVQMPPMIDLPREVYDALDDDDMLVVDEAVRDFLPRRFREESVSGPSAIGAEPSPK